MTFVLRRRSEGWLTLDEISPGTEAQYTHGGVDYVRSFDAPSLNAALRSLAQDERSRLNILRPFPYRDGI